MKVIIFTLLMGVSTVQASLDVSYELVKEGLGIVWGMDFSGDDLYFTEREGKIRKLNLNSKKVETFEGAPKVVKRNQGGMLDIKLHPEFEKNNIIYFTYSKKMGEYQTTALAQAKIEGKKLISFKDIFIAKGKSDNHHHYGSRITFDNAGHLFLSVGDRGQREKAQKLDNHQGKIIRLNLDGTVPKDKPFISKVGALNEIWSYGHRNPQGLFYDTVSKKLFEMEHGPRGGDEINVVEKGKNYGWPVITYGKEYWGPFSIGEGTHKEGMEQPLIKYVPSIAPSGLTVYNGEKFPKLKGMLISGALKLLHLNIVDQKGNEIARLFENQNLRIRSTVTGPKGEIYFSTDGGKIFRLIRKK